MFILFSWLQQLGTDFLAYCSIWDYRCGLSCFVPQDDSVEDLLFWSLYGGSASDQLYWWGGGSYIRIQLPAVVLFYSDNLVLGWQSSVEELACIALNNYRFRVRGLHQDEGWTHS